MALSYSVELILRDHEVLVVGGGAVAARKVAGLVEAGARVRVVSPRFAAELLERLDIVREEACYDSQRLGDARLVFACTDDARMNARVAVDARAAGRWCNVADDPENSDFLVPATLRRGGLTVAVGTGGASPRLAAKLRDEIESHLSPHLDILVAELQRARAIVLETVADPAVRRRIFETLCAECSLKLMARGDREAWRRWFERVLEHRGRDDR